MNKIRLGVIGTGLVFRYNHLPVLSQLSERFQIIALCNPHTEKAKALASEFHLEADIYNDYSKMIRRNDIDAVLVTVPIHLLSSISLDAISLRKHVFQEKPVSDTVKLGGQLIMAAKKNKVVLMVGENFRYRPEFRQVHSLVQKGLIGDPKLYRINDLHYTYPGGQWSQTPWRQKGEHSGGYLVDGGTHIIAGMRETVRRKIIGVHGLSASFYPELLSRQDDTLLLHLAFENGIIGQLAIGYGTIDPDARKPKMYGNKGTLVLNSAKKVIELWSVDKNAQVQTFPIETANDFMAEWRDFYDAIVNGKQPYSTAEDALVDLMIIEAGRRSSVSGSVIKF